MKEVKYIGIILFIILAIFLIPNISNATTTVTRNVYSNNGSMKFSFSGLNLDTTHEYEFGLTKTKAEKIENWHLITEYTANTAIVDVMTTTRELRSVLNTVDTGYITIKDRSTDKIVVEPYAVDLKIPFLRLTNYTVIPNGKEFGFNESDNIQIALRCASNSKAYYQYEKITDQNVINKYKEIKRKNGDYTELQNNLKQTVPNSNWKTWSYWNGHNSNSNGFGHTQKPISVPDSGLYYMWIYFSGDNLKNMYGYILVDNLEPDIILEEISLPKTQTIELGKAINIKLEFKPTNATNKIVTWKSSDESVATVDNVGKVTPKKVGSTIITVVSQDGNKKASCTVTVTEAQDNKNNVEDKDDKTPNDGNQNSGVTNNGNSNQDSTNNKGTNDKKDTTTAPIKKIPQAGQTIIITIIGLIALIGISIIMYKKFSQYKDIK